MCHLYAIKTPIGTPTGKSNEWLRRLQRNRFFWMSTGFSGFLVAPSLSSGATYLLTMVSVCMSVCLSVCLDVTFSVKGKIFDNRFGLIHVRTPKFFFSSLHLTLHLFISLISDNTRFGLIHVRTQKNFLHLFISSSHSSSLHLTNFR